QRAEALLEGEAMPRRKRVVLLACLEPRERFAYLRLKLDVSLRELVDRGKQFTLQSRQRGPVVVQGQVLADLLARDGKHFRESAQRRRLVVERELGQEARQRRVFVIERELAQD